MIKKLLILLSTSLLILCTACSSSNVATYYGNSTIYTEKDMDSAVKVMDKTFKQILNKDMKFVSAAYTDDSCNSQFNIDRMNEAMPGENFTQCIAFAVGFLTPDGETVSFTDYLGRKDGGQWKSVILE